MQDTTMTKDSKPVLRAACGEIGYAKLMKQPV